VAEKLGMFSPEIKVMPAPPASATAPPPSLRS